VPKIESFLSSNLFYIGRIECTLSNKSMDEDVKENKLLAYCWFACAFATATTTILAFNTKGMFLIPGILGISSLLVLVGRQRLSKYKLKPEIFRVYLRNIGLFITVWCSVSAVLRQYFHPVGN
jgi:hypothetical protein